MQDSSATAAGGAGLFRRLAALLYDALLVAAILFVATLPWLALTGGEAVTPRSSGPVAYLYRAWLAGVVFAYFGLSWTRGGQTLGMRAWRLRLLRADGGAPGWRDAALRFLLGTALAILAGLGLWWLRAAATPVAVAAAALLLLPLAASHAWIAFDRGNRSLQDIASRTRVVSGCARSPRPPPPP